MKKYLSILLLAVLFLTGCGASKSENIMYDSAPNYGYADMGFTNGYIADMDIMESTSKDFFTSSSSNKIEQTISTETPSSIEYSQKLIKNYSFEFETLEYDKSITLLKNKVSELGGYIENSNTSGKSTYRSFNATLRIPEEKINEFLETTNDIGEIIYSTETANDITLKYYDTKSQIEALEIQYDRILEILKKADKLEDVILLEQRLSDIQYQLNSHKSQIKVYDNLVNYVTIKINLREVKDIQVVDDDNFFTQIKKGLSSNLRDIAESGEDLLIFLIVGIPYFIIIGLVILVFVLIIKGIKKKKKKKTLNNENNNKKEV